MVQKKFRNTGLPALNESRVDRRRQLVTGRAKVGGGIPPKLFLWGLLVLVVGGFFYFRNSQAELEEQRQGILLKQRATAKLLSPKLIPLRDRVEKYARDLAKDGPERIEEGVDWEKVLSAPGLYLRLRRVDAEKRAKLREAAQESLRDGFTSCAFVDRSAGLPTSGKSCRESTECQPGELCNEFAVCQRPASPFNMRMVYRALSVLSPEWLGELEETNSDYKLLALERTLESITEVDIPIAIEILQRARYAIVVLDEDPKGGLPGEIKGTFESETERVQRAPHVARVGVWDLRADRLLARVRANASGELREAGTRQARGGPESQAARARQANSCALALAFKEHVLPQSAVGEPPRDP